MRCWHFSGCARCSWTGEVGRARYRNPGGFACRRFMDGAELLRSGGQTNFNPTMSRYFFLQNDIHSRNISLRLFSREKASDFRFCWQLGHWPRSFVTAFTWPLSWKSISSRSRGCDIPCLSFCTPWVLRWVMWRVIIHGKFFAKRRTVFTPSHQSLRQATSLHVKPLVFLFFWFFIPFFYFYSNYFFRVSYWPFIMLCRNTPAISHWLDWPEDSTGCTMRWSPWCSVTFPVRFFLLVPSCFRPNDRWNPIRCSDWFVIFPFLTVFPKLYGHMLSQRKKALGGPTVSSRKKQWEIRRSTYFFPAHFVFQRGMVFSQNFCAANNWDKLSNKNKRQNYPTLLSINQSINQ